MNLVGYIAGRVLVCEYFLGGARRNTSEVCMCIYMMSIERERGNGDIGDE